MKLPLRKRPDGFTMPDTGAHSLSQLPWWGPQPEGNDAEPYGVHVTPATPAAGQPHWRAVRVHHLTPDENRGNHHLLFDVLDEQGARLRGAHVGITWDGGEEIIALDKPDSEPGGNFPMWKGQVCAVRCIGLASDTVAGLSTAHPDEADGNTWFHHSFLIVFRRAYGGDAPAQSRIDGSVAGGAGLVARLLLDEGEVARTTVAADGAFAFTGLTAGTYRVAIEGTALLSDPIPLDGRHGAEVALRLEMATPPEASALRHFVLLASEADFLLALAYILAVRPAFGFRLPDAPPPERVTVIGGDVSAETLARLRDAGIAVDHIHGDADTVARALAERIAAA